MRDWYEGLREEMTIEIKARILQARTEGKDTSGFVVKRKKIRPKVIRPLFDGFTLDGCTGRTEKAHTELVEEKIIRAELGADLWSDDLQESDTESFEGTPLSTNEMDLMTRVLSVRDAGNAKNNLANRTLRD